MSKSYLNIPWKDVFVDPEEIRKTTTEDLLLIQKSATPFLMPLFQTKGDITIDECSRIIERLESIDPSRTLLLFVALHLVTRNKHFASIISSYFANIPAYARLHRMITVMSSNDVNVRIDAINNRYGIEGTRVAFHRLHDFSKEEKAEICDAFFAVVDKYYNAVNDKKFSEIASLNEAVNNLVLSLTHEAAVPPCDPDLREALLRAESIIYHKEKELLEKNVKHRLQTLSKPSPSMASLFREGLKKDVEDLEERYFFYNRAFERVQSLAPRQEPDDSTPDQSREASSPESSSSRSPIGI